MPDGVRGWCWCVFWEGENWLANTRRRVKVVLFNSTETDIGHTPSTTHMEVSEEDLMKQKTVRELMLC